jgi:carbon-monoxide dehydrogenase large subunit
MVPAHEAMPMTNAFGFQVDSGRLRRDRWTRRSSSRRPFDGFAARRRRERGSAAGGAGWASPTTSRATGGAPEENVDVRFEADGTVSLITGTQHIGQGHETTFPQILAHRLGVANAQHPPASRATPTLIPFGGGHGSSRATYMGGTALWRASDEIIRQGHGARRGRCAGGERRRISASSPITVQRAASWCRAPTAPSACSRSPRSAARRASRSTRTTPGSASIMTFPNGAHVVEVEVDPRNRPGRHWRATPAVDDYGVLVNPMVAAGQAHGAMAQGSGPGAAGARDLRSRRRARWWPASFMDYALPRADDLSSFDLGFNPTRCTTNPLGVKGCGEAGAIAAFPAIANAILDALAPLGVKGFHGPASPSRIWQAIQEA